MAIVMSQQNVSTSVNSCLWEVATVSLLIE